MFQQWRLREPFNGLSHFAGAAASAAGLLALLDQANGRPWHITAFAIYGASLILLYTASTLYHSLPVSPKRVQQLCTFDMVAIYLLIAGTYTPICLISMRGPWGWGLLAAAWGLALLGSALRIWWRGMPPWLNVALYLVMGWMSLPALPALAQALAPEALAWLVAGGLVYSAGVIVYATGRPCPWPEVMGSHGLWHLFVLGGSACHFVAILRYVAPSP